MNKIRTGVKYNFVKLIVVLAVVIISISSLCKKKTDENDNYLEPVNVSNDSGCSENPSVAIDSRNTVHLVWDDDTPGNEEILYAFKPEGGNWLTPVNISNNPQSSRNPCIAVDNNDELHIAWQQWIDGRGWVILYSYKSSAGNWMTPETISGEYMYVCPKIAVDNIGNIHITWSYGGYYTGIRYVMKTNQGTWTPQITIAEPAINYNSVFTVDAEKNVHLIWSKTKDDYSASDIFYSMKSENGTWSQPENISNTGQVLGSYSIIADNQRNIHCVWADMSLPYLTPRTFYRAKRPDGTWTTPLPPCTLRKVWLTSELAVGPQNDLYIAGGDSARLLYIIKPQGQAFSDTNLVGVVNKLFSLWKLVCDNNGVLHFVWERDEDIYWISYNPNPRR